MPAFLKIPENQLRKLYLIQKLSSRKIAKMFNCAYSTIDTKIHLAKLPIRNLAQAHIIYPRKDFSGNPSEKAYLIGFRIGDLRVRKRYKNSETILVDCGSTKPEQIELIKKLFMSYGRVWISKPINNRVQIECFLNYSFNFLLSPSIENLINSKINFPSFLAGFTDAEGSIFLSHNRAHYALGNYDLILLKQIKNSLKLFNIKCPSITVSYRKGLLASHGYRYNNDYWTLSIGKKSDLLKLFDLIGPFLQHRDRIRQMEIAIKNINMRNKLYGSK